MNLTDIKDTFAFLDSWEDKYRFIIDLGKELPELDDAERREKYLIRGCQSQVWFVPATSEAGALDLKLDSDAHIVRGLIALVMAAYNGRQPAEILSFDIDGLFDELELLQHLSPTRGNGLRAILAAIKEYAQNSIS